MEEYKIIKNRYYKIRDIEYRKDNGQVFTPLYVAQLMTEWVLNAENIQNSEDAGVLDPAVGLGAFFQGMIKNKFIYRYNQINEEVEESDDIYSGKLKICGYEKDYKLSRECKKLYRHYPDIFIHNKDYLLDWSNQINFINGYNNLSSPDTTGYDGIICNPPYLIYKKYNNKKYLSLFEEMLDIKLSGFTNLCMLFLMKSLTELKPGGRMAYIIPSEFMNADYGIEIKRFFKNYGSLKHVILLKYNLFEMNTTSAIFLFSNELNLENTEYETEKVHAVNFFSVNSREELLSLFSQRELKGFGENKQNDNRNKSALPYCLKDEFLDYENCQQYSKVHSILLDKKSNSDTKIDKVVVKNKELEPDKKWRFYYQKTSSSKYKNLVEFSEYARVLRGIATGANDFFLFNKSKKEKFQIANKYLIPCISRSSYIRGHFIKYNHFEKLWDEDKKVYLLDVYNKEPDSIIREYIKYGESQGYHQRYLTSHRNPWYKLEDKPPAPILARVFNRTGLKFVINDAKLYNLTAFHCVYIKSIDYSDLLKAYLLTETATDIIEDNRREYGDGLNKLEPNDINESLVLNLKIIKENDRQRIYTLYNEYRAMGCKNCANNKIYHEKMLKEQYSNKKNQDVNQHTFNLDSVNLLKQLNKIFLKYM